MTDARPIILPFPPSANSLWRNVDSKTLVSRQYRAWKKTAGLLLMAQRPAKVLGPYVMTLVATRPDRRRRDLANLEKACSDLLQACGVIRDDCDCQSLRLSWSASEPDPKAGVQIVLEPA